MKRWVAAAAALGLALSACGGDDDDAAAEVETEEATDSAGEGATTEPTEPASDDTTDDTTDDTADDGGGDDAGSDADGDDGGDDGGDDDGGNDPSGDPIRSIDDVPEVCREQMASFLREIEPLVSDIDWQTATLTDFEEIGTQFEQISEDYDAAAEDNGCNDLVFADDDDEFDLMIEFAGQEAPGTVGFFEFLASFGALGEGGGDGGGDAGAGGDAFEDCGDAVEFVQGLIDEYDSFTEVPAAELVKFSTLGGVLMSCTPEQQAFFDSPEVNDFLSE